MKIVALNLIVIFAFLRSFSQSPNWQALDLKKDGIFGISSDKAYLELLKGKKSNTVIIGIIDSGIDTLQDDLRPILWTDEGSGLHGWNYIGPETGKEDITHLVAEKKDFYDSLSYTFVPENFRVGYQIYRKRLPQLDEKIKNISSLLEELKTINQNIDNIIREIGKAAPGLEDFNSYKPHSENEAKLIKRIAKRLRLYSDWGSYRKSEITDIIRACENHLARGLNLEDNGADTATGDMDVSPDKLGPVAEPNYTAYHGTHVAGIIGAVRGNGIGLDGIADNVRIMMLKVNGAIRELRDKSLARAVRFAVDHGAKVINLSFGKPYTWDKEDVDEAIKYATLHDVVLIHASGNSGENLDIEDHFPNPVYLDGSGRSQVWIEVGASGPKDDSTLVATFSNYGKKDVDVFAPGVQIYSTLPFNQYASWDGTSMAAPVVAGVAALIREYYPNLSAIQIKDIIMKSVVKVNHPVFVRGSDNAMHMVSFSDICASGGIVNAYNALLLAEKMSSSKR